MPKASSRSFSCSSPIFDHNLSLLWNIWKYHPNTGIWDQSSLATDFFLGSQNWGLLSNRWFWTSSLRWLPSQKGRLLVCLQLQNHTWAGSKKKVQIIQATQQDFPLPLLFLALHTPLGRSWPVFSYLDSAKIRCYHLSSPVQFTWQVPSQRGWAVLASPQPHQTYRPCFSTFSLCGFKSYLSRFCLRNFWEIWNLKSTHMSPLSGRGAFIPATSLTGFENLEVTCQKVGLFWEGGQT